MTLTRTPDDSTDVQSANRIKAGPTSGGAAIPTYRALVQADMPVASGAGTGVVLAGPSLPGSPSDGQTYTKTVDGKTYVYNNSLGVWLGPERKLTFVPFATLQPWSTTPSDVFAAGIPATDSFALVGFDCIAVVGSPNDGTDFWTIAVVGPSFEYDTDTTTLTAGLPGFVPDPIITPILCGTGPDFISIQVGKNASPGDLQRITFDLRVRDALAP